jgi:hypothetical protein
VAALIKDLGGMAGPSMGSSLPDDFDLLILTEIVCLNVEKSEQE